MGEYLSWLILQNPKPFEGMMIAEKIIIKQTKININIEIKKHSYVIHVLAVIVLNIKK